MFLKKCLLRSHFFLFVWLLGVVLNRGQTPPNLPQDTWLLVGKWRITVNTCKEILEIAYYIGNMLSMVFSNVTVTIIKLFMFTFLSRKCNNSFLLALCLMHVFKVVVVFLDCKSCGMLFIALLCILRFALWIVKHEADCSVLTCWDNITWFCKELSSSTDIDLFFCKSLVT